MFDVRIDQKIYKVNDPVLTGSQLLELAERRPPQGWRIVAIKVAGSESLRPTEQIDLRLAGIEEFVTHQSDRVFTLEVNGVQHDWPAPSIDEASLRKLAGADAQQGIMQEQQGTPDRLIVPGTRVDLRPEAIEQFYSAARVIQIIVNARRRDVSGSRLTFTQIVALADGLPQGENVMYTITYRNGPSANPEGSLIDGQSVRIRKGMVFNVTATDRS